VGLRLRLVSVGLPERVVGTSMTHQLENQAGIGHRRQPRKRTRRMWMTDDYGSDAAGVGF
jgi:hypothetical protein